MSVGELSKLLARLVDGIEATPDDIALIAQSLTSTREARGLAFLALKKVVDGTSGVEADPTRDQDRTLEQLLAPCIQPLQNAAKEPDADIDPQLALPPLALLTSLFPLAPKTGVRVLQRSLPYSHKVTEPGADAGGAASFESVGADAGPDVMGLFLELAELDGPVQIALAEMLAAATGSKAGRAFVRSRAMEWLEGAVDYRPAHGRAGQSASGDLGGMCAVALSKLSMAQDGDDAVADQTQGKAGQGERDISGHKGNELFLADKMAGIIINTSAAPSSASTSSSTLISALEGLSVLSTRPPIKQKLAQDNRFLGALLALSPVPERKGGSLPVSLRDGTTATVDSSLADTAAPQMPVNTGICYGITTILLHLSLRKPVLSAEDEQMAKLRQMASAASLSDRDGSAGAKGKTGDRLDEVEQLLDADEAVRSRVDLLYRAGVVPALRGLVRAASTQVKLALGRLCLMLVMEQQHRAVFVRDGGFKVLGAVIRDCMPAGGSPPGTGTNGGSSLISPESTSGSTTLNVELLPALQALAKLAITTPPPLLFPPPYQTTALNALVPLYTLLTHPESSTLQTFEALMALTNLASIDPSIADRIVTAIVGAVPQNDAFRGKGSPDVKEIKVLNKVEELLMDDNRMVRRAATELACNLAGSAQGFAYLSGESDPTSNGAGEAKTRPASRTAQRLHLLLVLLDSDDLPTRLAAGGALAIVSESTTACLSMLSIDGQTSSKRDIWQRLADLFRPREMENDEEGEERIMSISTEAPDEGMMMRAAVMLANLLPVVTANRASWAREKGKVDKAGVYDALLDQLKKGCGQDLAEPIVQALQTLKTAS